MFEIRRQVGTYLTNEGFTILRPIEIDRAAGRPWIVGTHGRGGDASSNLQPLYGGEPFYELARNGFPHIGIDAGGPTEFASDKAFTAIEAALAYVRANFGAHPTKFYMAGASMGALTALAYFGSGSLKAQIAGVVGCIPAIDLGQLYTNNPAYQPEINTAWGPEGGYTIANRDRKDPTRLATAGAYSGRGGKIQLWYATDDPIITVSSVTNFASVAGVPSGQVINMGAIGHFPGWTPAPMVSLFKTWDAA